MEGRPSIGRTCGDRTTLPSAPTRRAHGTKGFDGTHTAAQGDACSRHGPCAVAGFWPCEEGRQTTMYAELPAAVPCWDDPGRGPRRLPKADIVPEDQSRRIGTGRCLVKSGFESSSLQGCCPTGDANVKESIRGERLSHHISLDRSLQSSTNRSIEAAFVRFFDLARSSRSEEWVVHPAASLFPTETTKCRSHEISGSGGVVRNLGCR